MWLEHHDLIQRHFQVGAASILLIEQLERLLATPVASIHRVRHCHFGGKAVKPTRLVAIRLPALACQLAQWKHPVTPSCTLICKNPDGTSRTFQAKEYSRRLSAALAYARVAVATATWITPTTPMHESASLFLSTFQPLLTQAVHSFCADVVDSPLPISKFNMKWQPPDCVSYSFLTPQHLRSHAPILRPLVTM